MDEEQNVQTTGNDSTAEPQDQQEKTFTQDEVNDIVEKRLARERKKFSGILAGKDPKELELDEREQVVARKEMQISALGSLSDMGIQKEALELLNYENEERLEQSLKVLQDVVNTAAANRVNELLKGGTPLKAVPQEAPDSNLRNAFGLKR